MTRATDPTTASKTVARVSANVGGTPLAAAAFKPLPFGPHAPQVSVRANNAPVNHFQSSGAPPHMVHPASGVGGHVAAAPKPPKPSESI